MSSGSSRRDRAQPDSADAAALAAEVQALLAADRRDAAAERFGDLVTLWQRRALRLAMHYLGNAADADDAVQDAFVKLYANLQGFRPELGFDAWFGRILVNACRDRLRGRTRLARWLSPIDGAAHDGSPADRWATADPSPLRRLEVASAWSRLGDEVRALPERQREVFLLCHLDEQTPGEAADTLGMNPATVRVHLFRALRTLRRRLGGWV